jgi:hypothetical protein
MTPMQPPPARELLAVLDEVEMRGMTPEHVAYFRHLVRRVEIRPPAAAGGPSILLYRAPRGERVRLHVEWTEPATMEGGGGTVTLAEGPCLPIRGWEPAGWSLDAMDVPRPGEPRDDSVTRLRVDAFGNLDVRTIFPDITPAGPDVDGNGPPPPVPDRPIAPAGKGLARWLAAAVGRREPGREAGGARGRRRAGAADAGGRAGRARPGRPAAPGAADGAAS